MYAPHTWDISQVLDLLLFGTLKRHKKYLPRDEDEVREVDHILRIFRPYEAVTTSTRVRDCQEKVSFLTSG
jgi:hypothetical protein